MTYNDISPDGVSINSNIGVGDFIGHIEKPDVAGVVFELGYMAQVTSWVYLIHDGNGDTDFIPANSAVHYGRMGLSQ